MAYLQSVEMTVTLKGRYQLSTELKDKETSSLKEELKQLQVFKTHRNTLPHSHTHTQT